MTAHAVIRMHRAQFLEGEGIAQVLESVAREVPHQPKLPELALEQVLLERRIGHLRRFQAVAGGRVDGDAAPGVQEAGAKGDRGDVAFAGGSQAQDETQCAGREVRLVGMRHHGGIEQRRGLE